MKNAAKVLIGLLAAVLVVDSAAGQDWSQWRGDHRDAKVAEFSAPSTWPKELTKKWEVEIGNGAATPSLVGDRLYTFSRQDDSEVIPRWTPRPVRRFGRTRTKRKGRRARPAVFPGRGRRRPSPRAKW